jgi:predicted acylesterase/phospholipase RssA
MPLEETDAVKTGKDILKGKHVPPSELFAAITKLKTERAFGLGRKLLDKYADDPALRGDAKMRVKLAQQRALCTYKDPDLLSDEKLDAALRILKEGDDFERTTDRETLGLAGAIYKRKWELEGHERDLEESLQFYERAYTTGTTEDYGWTGINAAFVLDLLAGHESSITDGKAAQELGTADLRRKRANEIRQEIASRLPPLLADSKNQWLKNEWWFWATLGEAYFGIDKFTEAGKFLAKGNELPNVPDWERESTARQLATLLIVKRKTSPEAADAAHKCLLQFLGNDYALTSVIRGKLGLALSGGGFRASLYHIGMLAKLAELDLLRSIEYLSCVSGGSIIGAHYYLGIRHLLQSTGDNEITRQDYIDLVRRIEKEFLAGVQRNIRTRVLSEWRTSLKMIFVPDYSRTTRAGELYESELYARVDDGETHAPRWLDELLITPKGEDPVRFRPKDHNWRRSNKVPILILNATALNTGHNWQFTATWMGEPPGTIDTIDANYRLRRMYYDDAPDGNRKVRLGHAVAASACVPGIFEPIPLNRLYERQIPKYERDSKQSAAEPIVRLVDGGVHDNQGVAALLDQGCSVFIVSDASGQMNALDFPSNKILGVPLRANDILQARVREAQYRELCSRRRAGLLKGLMFIHLKKDLPVELVDWIDCQDPSEPPAASPLTPYGVQREIQRRLAAVRTDLDSFSDAEAYALMCSAYLMTEHALATDRLLGFDVPQAQRERWEFLKLEDLMKQPPQGNPLIRQLKVSDRLFGKIWLLSPPVRMIGGMAVLGILALLGAFIWKVWLNPLPSFSWGELIIFFIAIGFGVFTFDRLSSAFNYRKTLDQVLIGVGLMLGSLLAKVHLHIFDKIFVRQGNIDRLLSRNKNRGDV